MYTDHFFLAIGHCSLLDHNVLIRWMFAKKHALKRTHPLPYRHTSSGEACYEEPFLISWTLAKQQVHKRIDS